MLRAVVLTLDDESRGEMPDTDRARHFINILPPWAPGTECVEIEIFLEDLKHGGRIKRRNVDGREARLLFPIGVEGGDMLDPVDAAFAPELSVGIKATDLDL